MKSIKRVFDYYNGIHKELFWNLDNSKLKVVNKCPINGKPINYNNPPNEDDSDILCLIRGEVPEASLGIVIPSPCDDCSCLQLAEKRIRSGCDPSGTLKYCFDGEHFESCPGNCEYEVIGICKRYCEIEPEKITLMKWA